MKSIREKVQTDYPKSDILEEEMARICYRVGFEKGANAVLEEIEDYLENYTMPKDSLLKFYILSIFSDIHDKIKQLKGE